jgi:hypothetical protein
MVHSNGTRFESQRFRIDFTGSRKYSGRSCDFRDVSAVGEHAASRAIPTNGAAGSSAEIAAGAAGRCAAPAASEDAAAFRIRSLGRRGTPPVAGNGGGQSAVGLSGLLSHKPISIGFGPRASGLQENRADCRTGRRRSSGTDGERKEDIAHLEQPKQYFAFSSPCQANFRLIFAPVAPAISPAGKPLLPPGAT